MSRPSDRFVEKVLKDLAPIGTLGTRRYFGGLAVLVELTQFAMLMGDTLYFKVDDETRPAFEALGGKPFRYTTKRGEVTVRALYPAPTEILADPDRLCEWATQALATARASGRGRASIKARKARVREA